jgi:hypothetical protein
MMMTLKSIARFFIIFGIIVLLEIPGCVVIFADDAGQIDSFKYETLIQLSKDAFAAPLILITGIPRNLNQLALIYIGNLILLSVFIALTVSYIRFLKIKSRRNQLLADGNR